MIGKSMDGMGPGELGRFWTLADQLVRDHAVVVDRPAGSRHPRFPEIVYPFDYGYLEGTGAVDGGGVDCWRGSLEESRVTGAIVTVDTVKADSEVKWLIGCSDSEMQTALATHRTSAQAAVLIVRDAGRRAPIGVRAVCDKRGFAEDE